MTAHATIQDWLRLPVEERRERLALVAERAAASRRSHGVYTAVADRPSSAATGLLEAVPFGVKDNIDAAGFDTAAGTPSLVGARAERDANVVHALRAEGAVVIGKTGMHELGFGITSDNPAFGPVRNPVDPALSAGGSSGGSAASVAIGDVPFSLGTDTGGSVTVPASFCGVVGFRPTTGRYPGDGLVHLSWSCDTIGVHAGTVEDVALVDRVIVRGRPAPGPTTAEGIRIGLPAAYLQDLDPRVEAVVGAAVEALRSAGVAIVPVPDAGDLRATATGGFDLVHFEAARTLAGHVAALGAPHSALTLARMAELAAAADVRQVLAGLASAPPGVEAYDRARATRWEQRRHRQRLLDDTGLDALLFPSVPVLPPRAGEETAVDPHGARVPAFAAVGRHAGPGAFAGFPMLAVPAGRSGGAPVGVTLEGAAGDDDRLLAVGRVVERVLRPER